MHRSESATRPTSFRPRSTSMRCSARSLGSASTRPRARRLAGVRRECGAGEGRSVTSRSSTRTKSRRAADDVNSSQWQIPKNGPSISSGRSRPERRRTGGRIGSVHLTAFMTIERYSHVMHLVSEVRAGFDRSSTRSPRWRMLPAGTVSGAPKVRRWKSSTSWSRYDGGRRGSRGYVGWGAQVLDTAIALRTCVIRGDRAWVAGRGRHRRRLRSSVGMARTRRRPAPSCSRSRWPQRRRAARALSLPVCSRTVLSVSP